MDLDCTYGATYYLILGLMKGLHTYASINKLFNQPMGGVCDLLIECLLRDGATLLDACCLANGNTVWCAARDWRAMCDCPALGLTSRFQVQCRMVPAKAVPSACVD